MSQQLQNITIQLRKRLLEFLVHEESQERSIHINSLEIALCLVEFSLETKPSRAIIKEEEIWFQAGFYIDLVLGNSEWADIVDLYYEMLGEVKKNNFFRN